MSVCLSESAGSLQPSDGRVVRASQSIRMSASRVSRVGSEYCQRILLRPAPICASAVQRSSLQSVATVERQVIGCDRSHSLREDAASDRSAGHQSRSLHAHATRLSTQHKRGPR